MENIVFGKKPLMENLVSGNIINVDLTKSSSDLIDLLKKHNITFHIREKNFFNKYDSKLNHQFIVTTLRKCCEANNLQQLIELSKTKSESVILVVDSLQDPQNFGSILRTCDAFGVDGVIYKKDKQVQINDFVSKSSMGAIQHLNLIKVTNLAQTISELKDAGYWIYTSTLSPQSNNYKDVKYDKKSVLIVGNEEKGVSPLLIQKSDFLIKIPMIGKVQSLNVAVATGIILSRIKN